jgi:alkyl sulfatase BDS1-like metallo-beta-lactamase superfamily hydrolase
MPLRLKRFLEEVLDLLREDFPAELEKLTKDADGLTYLQLLDSEEAVIIVRGSGIRIASGARKKEINIRVRMSRACLFAVLEGRQTLAEALDEGGLKVFGDPQTLLRCYAIWERVISLARTSPRFYFLTYELR